MAAWSLANTRWVIATIAITISVMSVTVHAIDPVPAEQFAPGVAAGALCFTNQSQQARCLSQWRGRVILLNLWATWCVPCTKEMPQLDQLQARFGGAGFEVVAVSVDRRGVPAVQHYFSRHQLRHLAVYVDEALQADDTLGARGIPVSLLIDRNGIIVERWRGPIEWASPARQLAIQQLVENGRTTGDD